jgi:hypothetical protein
MPSTRRAASRTTANEVGSSARSSASRAASLPAAASCALKRGVWAASASSLSARMAGSSALILATCWMYLWGPWVGGGSMVKRVAY